MIYEWQCKKCGVLMDVKRKVDDYKIPPQASELLDMADHVHEWERVIGVAAVPFQHLRHSGVFADEHGNYAPWSRNM